jgi:hypothetical protein
MMHKTFRRAFVAALAFTVAACGDNPLAANADLSQAEVEEMMDAMSAIGAFSPFGLSVQSASGNVAFIVSQINESAPCPNGGTFSTNGSMNINETTGNFTAQLTNNYNSCKATSSTNRVWTFNGDPNISQTMSFTSNQTTGAFQMTGSQNGGLSFSSNGASGRCSISINYSVSVTSSGTETGSITGTVCGKSVNQSL